MADDAPRMRVRRRAQADDDGTATAPAADDLTATAPAASRPTHAPLTVVGIGASAGGLKALQDFFSAVPVNSGFTYVVILHLDPSRESQMAHLLQAQASIPVVQVTERVAMEPDHAYIIPPTHYLAVDDGHLVLSERGERGQHAPIDLFFRSLGATYGVDSVAVVLSGTGADGASGVCDVKQSGGITVAQTPDEAEYQSMPRSAIASGQIDLVLAAVDMPAEIARVKHSDSSLPVIDEAERTEPLSPPETERLLRQVFSRLHARTGHDFSGYKRSTVLRRLDRRLRVHGIQKLEDYVRLLGDQPQESTALFNDLLISVSSFFRDPEAFQAFELEVVPALFGDKGRSDTIRGWVAGCATGEEAYSVAMLLREHAETLPSAPYIQIFATDIDERSCRHAREGIYPATIAEDLSPERLERFFERENGGYQIKKAMREHILFATHDLLKDPPFSKLDFICCRNVLIYLAPETQKRVLESFHYGLNPGGILFLGTSESAGHGDLFVPLDAKQRIYRRAPTAHPVIPRLGSTPIRNWTVPEPGGQGAPEFSYGAVHMRMIEAYAPPSVVVDDQGRVVHLSPGAGRYLRLAGGEPSRKLVDLAPKTLSGELRSALFQAFQAGEPTFRQVRTEVEGRARVVDLHVRPLEADGDVDGFALVVFDEHDEPEAAPEPPTDEVEGRRLATVEEELRRTQQELEATIQARDATIEELQSANEELISINEEQKANAEELDTSREELQSINEELTTVNQEHRTTIEQLKQVNADIQNLISTTEIGTIFLDGRLRVRRFTPTTTEIFHLTTTDQGHELTHVTHGLRYPDLAEDLKQCLASLQTIEREVESEQGGWYEVRIHPYRSGDDRLDGLVLTFYDITKLKELEANLRDAVRRAEDAGKVKEAFMATIAHEFRTPLNGILGHADILSLDEHLTEAQQRSLERIKAGVRHLSLMIDELLTLARTGTAQDSIHWETVDAATIGREAVELCETLTTAKGLTLEMDVQGPDCEIETDRGKARQVLVNLLGNAIKYTDRGGIRLAIRADGGEVAFEVRDTGIGIAPEHHEQIFERFWQVADGNERALSGLGLGLSAAREFARLLGGDVTVRSTRGHGSVFTLLLPLRRSEAR